MFFVAVTLVCQSGVQSAPLALLQVSAGTSKGWKWQSCSLRAWDSWVYFHSWGQEKIIELFPNLFKYSFKGAGFIFACFFFSSKDLDWIFEGLFGSFKKEIHPCIKQDWRSCAAHVWRQEHLISKESENLFSSCICRTLCCVAFFFFFQTGKAQISTAWSRWCLKLPKFLLCNFLFHESIPAGNLLSL